MTFNLQRQLAKAIPYSWEKEVQDMLYRHTSGDWGDLGESGREINNTAFEKDASIFSTYHTSDGTAVWIINPFRSPENLSDLENRPLGHYQSIAPTYARASIP